MKLTVENTVSTQNALQRHLTENSKKYSQKRNCAVRVPILHMHVSVSDYSIIGLPVLLQENTVCGPILGIYKSLTDT